MRKASPYLPWNKAAGSALLLGVSTYLWASALGVSRLTGLSWREVLAISSLAPLGFIVWADRAAELKFFRVTYLAAMAVGLLPAIASTFRRDLAPWVLASSFFIVGPGLASLMWQRDRTPTAWQRKTLWAFVFAASPTVITGPSEPLHEPPLFLLGLFMVAGTTLCLAYSERGTEQNRSGRRLASITALLFLAGWLVSSLAPGASSAASWGVRGLLTAMQAAFMQLLKPVGWLVEWLIGILTVMITKGTENEGPLNPFVRENLVQELEEHQTSAMWTIVGWILALVVLAFVIRALWTLLDRYALRKRDSEISETRSSEWSALSAANWAALKAKELAAPLVALVAGRLRRKRPGEDPLVLMYGEFLMLAAEWGYPRRASQTPLEFSRALAEAKPDSSSHIGRISSLFSSRFYAGRPASPEDLASAQECLEALRVSPALDRKDSVL